MSIIDIYSFQKYFKDSHFYRARGSFIGSLLPVDKNIVFHRYIAWVVAFFAGVHMYQILEFFFSNQVSLAHMFNYNRLSQATPADLTKMYGTKAPAAAPTTYKLAFQTLPGTTGNDLCCFP